VRRQEAGGESRMKESHEEGLASYLGLE